MPVVTDYTALLSGNYWNGIEVTGEPVIVTFTFPTTAPAYDSSVRGFRGEVQRHQAKRIFTSLPSSARMAWSGVLNPRHLRGVRLAVRMISWMS